MTTTFDEEAALAGAKLPAGARVAVIGSTSFWHEESAPTCTAIGELLADLDDLILLTGGVRGVGEFVGRGYFNSCMERRRAPRVVHVLPHGCRPSDYGTTLFAGNGMKERREVLGRLGRVFVVVEGGPGTEHEATVAAAHGAVLVPVGRSGGHAGTLYPRLARPLHVDAHAWTRLADPGAAPGAVAAAVAEIVDSCVRHGV